MQFHIETTIQTKRPHRGLREVAGPPRYLRTIYTIIRDDDGTAMGSTEDEAEAASYLEQCRRDMGDMALDDLMRQYAEND
ncbi:MAG: hypothetical protein MZV65_39320 [Chromatiales bacterium]|nr:hypothetical protein [Chromatiales bacterium]